MERTQKEISHLAAFLPHPETIGSLISRRIFLKACFRRVNIKNNPENDFLVDSVTTVAIGHICLPAVTRTRDEQGKLEQRG